MGRAIARLSRALDSGEIALVDLAEHQRGQPACVTFRHGGFQIRSAESHSLFRYLFVISAATN